MSPGVWVTQAFPESKASSQPSSPHFRTMPSERRGSALESLSLGMFQGRGQTQARHILSNRNTSDILDVEIITWGIDHLVLCVYVKVLWSNMEKCVYLIQFCFSMPMQDADCFDRLQFPRGGTQSHQRPSLWGWIQEDWHGPPVSGGLCFQPRHQTRLCPKGTRLYQARCIVTHWSRGI